MYGVLPKSVKGIGTLHNMRGRLISYKKLSRLPQETVKIHVRRCSVKSKLLTTLQTYSSPNAQKEKEKDILEDKVPVCVNKIGISTANLNLDDTESSLLKFKNISELTNVTPEKQVKLAEDSFEMLKSNNVPRTEEHYLGLLKCYSKSKSCPNLEDLLSKIEEDGVQLSVTLQQSISRCLAQNGQHELLKLIEYLNQSGVEVAESVYEELLYCYAASGNVDKAAKECKKMIEKNAAKERHLQMCLFRGLINSGIESSVIDKLAELVVLGYNFSFDEIYLMFKEILLHQHLHMIPHVIQTLKEDKSLLQNLQNLLTKLINEENVENAFLLLHSMYKYSAESRMEIPVDFYKKFIDALIAMNHPLDDTINKCKELRKIEECQYVMEYLLYNCLVSKKFAESLMVLHGMAESGANLEPYYFWPLLIEAHKRFDIEGLIYVVKTMVQLDVCPNSETLLNYVYPYFNPYNVFQYFKLIALSSKIFQFYQEVFIIYALENGYIKECLHLLRKRPLPQNMSYYFLRKSFMKAFKEGKPDEALINLLQKTQAVDPCEILSELWSEGNEEQFRNVLKLFVSMGVKGKQNYIMVSVFNKSNLPEDIANEIKEFLLMTDERSSIQSNDSETEKESIYECMEVIDYMEIHVAELKAKNMNITGQIFRLLKYYMKIGFYNRALNMRDELFRVVGHDIELSPSYLNCICRLYEYEGNDAEAMRYYRLVREEYPDFLIDVAKVVGVSKVIIRSGNFDALMDLFDRMPKWHGNVLLMENKMKKILNEVATLGDPVKTKIVFDKLLQKNFILVTSNTLQPFITTYLEMGNIDDAMKEFHKLISQYKIVPAPMDFIWYSIQHGDFAKMEEIVDVAMSNAEMQKQNLLPFITLRFLACLGDEKIFRKYLTIYDISIDDSRFLKVLSWHNIPGVFETRMVAFRIFLSVAASSCIHMYADLVVEQMCFDVDITAIKELRKFYEELGILSKYKRKLDRTIKLLTLVEKTSNRSLFPPVKELSSFS